jgi:hypothetical protein
MVLSDIYPKELCLFIYLVSAALIRVKGNLKITSLKSERSGLGILGFVGTLAWVG